MYRKLSFLAFLALIASSTLAQQIYIVDLAGTGDFTSIHEAVEEASSGDTIRVQPDQYAFTAALGPVEVDKKLVIIGSGYMPVEDGGTELVDITGDGYFNITSSGDGTVIKGFRVQGATDFLDTEAGTSNTTIEENLFITGTNIIGLAGSADTLRSNIFVGTGAGSIVSTATNVQVTNNIFSGTLMPAAYYGLTDFSNATGGTIAYNLFLNSDTNVSYNRAAIYIRSGTPEIYSNGFVNTGGPIVATSVLVQNNGYYNSSAPAIDLNPVNEAPDFLSFDVDNETLDKDAIDENDFDLRLDEGSEWIDAGRTGTPYLDTDGSRSDIGIYAGPTPFSDGRGAPSVPVVIEFQVTPTTVSPTGTITITATGRIGDGD